MTEFKPSILLESEKGKKNTFAVANCILDYAKNVTNLKLQKLVFFAYGLHLSLYKERLFESPIEAWKLGPVVKDIYDEFKNHGRGEITTRATVLLDDNEFLIPTIADEYAKEKMSVIATCLYYGNNSAPELVDLTHKMDCWKKTYDAYLKANSAEEVFKSTEMAEIGIQHNFIKDEDIFADFSKIKSSIVDFVNKC